MRGFLRVNIVVIWFRKFTFVIFWMNVVARDCCDEVDLGGANWAYFVESFSMKQTVHFLAVPQCRGHRKSELFRSKYGWKARQNVWPHDYNKAPCLLAIGTPQICHCPQYFRRVRLNRDTVCQIWVNVMRYFSCPLTHKRVEWKGLAAFQPLNQSTVTISIRL